MRGAGHTALVLGTGWHFLPAPPPRAVPQSDPDLPSAHPVPGGRAGARQEQHPDLVCAGGGVLAITTVLRVAWALCRRITGTTMSNTVSNSRSNFCRSWRLSQSTSARSRHILLVQHLVLEDLLVKGHRVLQLHLPGRPGAAATAPTRLPGSCLLATLPGASSIKSTLLPTTAKRQSALAVSVRPRNRSSSSSRLWAWFTS